MFKACGLCRVRELIDDPQVVDRPTSDELSSLLLACFRASLRTEEGRRTQLNVAFVQPYGQGRPNEESHGWWPLRFEEPRKCSDRELAKLAQAVHARQALVGVRRATASESGRLTIWGILVVGPSMWKLSNLWAMKGMSVGPPYLTVQVVAPGALAIHGPKGSLRLVGDEPEDGRPVPLIELAWAPTWSDVVGSESAAWPTLWARTVSVLLHFVGEAGHGGALFVLPDDAVPNALDVKYCIESASAMLKAAALPTLDAEAAENAAIAQSVTDAATIPYACAAMLTTESRQQKWIDAGECVAHLAGVDGALLLTRDLRLRGFGAVVRHVGELPPILRAVDAGALDRQPYDLSASGTRHRSAAVFCKQNPGAAAFVVSQDGEMSAMRSIDETVIVWHIKPQKIDGGGAP